MSIIKSKAMPTPHTSKLHTILARGVNRGLQKCVIIIIQPFRGDCSPRRLLLPTRRGLLPGKANCFLICENPPSATQKHGVHNVQVFARTTNLSRPAAKSLQELGKVFCADNGYFSLALPGKFNSRSREHKTQMEFSESFNKGKGMQPAKHRCNVCMNILNIQTVKHENFRKNFVEK